MRLTVLGPNWNSLAEPFAGGQESVAAGLVKGLRGRGHHVRLYAAAGTPTDLADELFTYAGPPELSLTARLDPHLPQPQFLADHHAFASAINDLAHRPGADLILNQSLHHLPLALSPLLPSPMLTTLHTPPLPWMEHGASLGAATNRYVAVSAAMARMWTTLPDVQVIPNGIDERTFVPGPGGEALIWVGRITPEKGLPIAIEAARAAGRRLSVIGPISDRLHYEQDVEPLLGSDVRYLGHLPHHRSREVVRHSAACLVTPRWDEPFGLVAAEAMMCGTPAIVVARGGLPEVVGTRGGIAVPDPGPSGDLPAALAAAVPAALAMDRSDVRADAVARLSFTAMLDAYEEIIRVMVAQGQSHGQVQTHSQGQSHARRTSRRGSTAVLLESPGLRLDPR